MKNEMIKGAKEALKYLQGDKKKGQKAIKALPTPKSRKS
jgi:hypothetical protein